MANVSYKLKDLDKRTIKIGYVGENDHMHVLIDCKEVFDEYPAAMPTMAIVPPEGEDYPKAVTRNGNIVEWLVKNSDVAAEGDGEFQLTFTEDNVVKKSVTGRFRVERSISGNGTAPSGIDDWLTDANEALTAVEAATQDAENAAENQPKINTSGYWEIWDAETGAYVATTVKAQGDKGDPGDPGSPGDPTELIDDTAGEGDTGKTWSADKLDDQFGSVLNAIQGLTPDAQQSDIGKALILKTIDQTGKPTAFEYGEGGGGSVDPSAIAQAVDDWCDENITNPNSPPLDRSLSSGSAAAPADMVGVINEELDFVTGQEDLLTNAVRTDGKGLDGSGAIINSSNYEIYEIEYDGSYGTFTASVAANTLTVKAIAFYNASDVLISALDYKTTSGASVFTNQTIPENTAKIVLSNRKKSGSVSASYPVQKSQRLEDIEDDIAENEKEILKVLSVMQYSEKNLFDVGTALDGLIAPTNGEFSENAGNIASDFIPVEPNTIYTISARNTETGLFYLAGCRYAVYTSAKVYITGEQSDYGQFRTPSNAAYVRFSLKKPVKDIQIERRSFATKYVRHNSHSIMDESDTMFLNYPRKVYAVPGIEYNWYTFNVTPEKHTGLFEWRIRKTNTKIHNYGRFLRWEDNNTSVGTEKVIIEATSETKRGTKIFDIVSSDPSDLDNVSVLVLGDSTTANGYVVTDLHGYDGNENKITTLGTLGTSPNNHEGRSGWTLNMYFTQATNNPFYNPTTQTFDAEYYFNQTGVDVPDLFIINLGINDMHYDSDSLVDAKQTADAYIEKVNTIITSLRNVDANMKVAICMTIPPNVDPWGFGAAGTNIIGYDQYRISNLVLCEKLIDEFDYRESEGLYLIPINASLDTQYNMPTSAQLPNSRASETIMLPDTAGNVHPNAGGYYQIADVIYAFLCATFKTT